MALLHLVVQLAAGWLAVFGHPAPPVPVPPVAVTAPAPAPAGAPAVAPPPAAPAPVHEAPAGVPTVAPPVLSQPGPPAEPSCGDGEQWQGEFGCVAVQLPEESGGRAYG